MTSPASARFPFSAVVGHDDLRLALLLNAVHPSIGGVLVRGEKGTAKSTVVRALAALLQRKNYYFIPFGQDDSYKKPCSLKADFTQLPDTLEAALRGVQLQPILL